jgi:hypothetical protein
VFLQASFYLDILIHQGGEINKVLNKECKLDVRVEPFMELLLPTSISGDVFFSIAV